MCVAGGEGYTDIDKSGVMFAMWNGHTWSWNVMTSLPDGDLASVDCVTANFCAASGTYGDDIQSNFVAIWNGAKWTIRSMPSDQSDVAFANVSCSSPTLCLASFSATSVEEWNGMTWTTHAFSLRALGDSSVSSISCGASLCAVAFGDTYGFNNQPALMATWRSTGWTYERILNAHSPQGFLDVESIGTVTCVSTTYCVDLGTIGVGQEGGQEGFAATWNGASWNSTALPAADADSADVEGVACASADFCVASGETNSIPHIFKLTWNGIRWSLLYVPPSLREVYQQDNIYNPGSFESCVLGGECTIAFTYYSTGYGPLPVAFSSSSDSWGTGTSI
jgi:hypothetical protein